MGEWYWHWPPKSRPNTPNSPREDDAPEPTRKGGRFGEFLQVEIGLEKGFLGRVLGEVKIP
jgi:hypothetical protein